MPSVSFQLELIRFAQRRRHAAAAAAAAASFRCFSVRELPWCAPTDSPVRRQVRLRRRDGTRNSPTTTAGQDEPSYEPIDKFGIVAAMAKDSRVIGVDGTLPWKQSLDRQIFKNLTRNGVLIVGRRTLQEECTGSLDHVRHAKHCVVVSTTLSDVNELWGNAGGNQIEERDRDWKMLRVAASLGEALHIANRLSVDSVESQVNEPSLPQLSSPQSPFKSDLMCWVAGGERLFEEALKHPSAKEVHLSIVNVDVDTTNIPVANVAKFPAKYRWDHNYKPVFIETFENREDFQPDEPTFSYQVFQRIERNKPQ